MDRKKIISLLVVGALAAGAFFVTGAARSVFAQTSTPSQATPGSSQPGQPGADQGMRGHGAGGYSEQDLATALGITTDQLTAAEKTANTEALKQAVEKGLITQAQADQLSANGSNGRGFMGFPGIKGSDIDYNALLAKALGISTDQLQAARLKAVAASLAAQVKNGTLTQDQADLIQGRQALSSNANFQASMKTAYEAAIKQAVTDGVITQAQADQLLKDASSTGGWMGLGMDGFGGPHGFGGGPGGPGGPGQNPGQQTAPTAVPSSSGG